MSLGLFAAVLKRIIYGFRYKLIDAFFTTLLPLEKNNYFVNKVFSFDEEHACGAHRDIE